MVRKPKVTIAFPVYNGASSMERALDSLLAQSFEDFELIISDNGSTDDTASICQKYLNLDPRISYHRQRTNVGGLENYRFLLNRAQGEYFFWAPHDDWWDRDFIKIGVRYLERNPEASCVFGRVEYIDKNGEDFLRHEPPYRLDNDSRLRRIFNYITYRPTDNLCYSLIRKDVLKDYKWELSLCPDKKLIMHLLLKGKIIDGYGMRYKNYYSFKSEQDVCDCFIIDRQKINYYRLKGFRSVIKEIYTYTRLYEFFLLLIPYCYGQGWLKYYSYAIIKKFFRKNFNKKVMSI
jgi:glycosyltransferase involved in cell wall biosynthesis